MGEQHEFFCYDCAKYGTIQADFNCLCKETF